MHQFNHCAFLCLDIMYRTWFPGETRYVHNTAKVYINEVHAIPACFSFLGFLMPVEKAAALKKYAKVLIQWMINEYNVIGYNKPTGIE